MRNVSGHHEPTRRISVRAVACLATIAAMPLLAAEPSSSSAGDLNALVRASLRTEKTIVQAGAPVWVDFVLINQTENRLTLRVPDLSADAADYPEMGLPVEHVFSGPGFTGPRLEDESGQRRDSKVTVRPKDKVPAIKLAPYASVGLRLDMSEYYPSLLRPGKYNLVWQPYNASIISEPLSITVLAERQAVILTDMGKMTVRFFYDKAPAHVQNFIELIEQRFYDNLTFNRIIPGGLIQGGDSLGNRRGVRPDGKRLTAEFNNVPFELGTVGMARSSNDPDSASAQFFICLGRQPGFDGQQTAFGYLVGEESIQTLRRIAAAPTGVYNGMSDYPKKPVYIRAISLETVPSRERTAEPRNAATTQPGASLDRERGAGEMALWASEARPNSVLPGLRAQGTVGQRPATAPE